MRALVKLVIDGSRTPPPGHKGETSHIHSRSRADSTPRRERQKGSATAGAAHHLHMQ